jgi:hypothetical protein
LDEEAVRTVRRLIVSTPMSLIGMRVRHGQRLERALREEFAQDQFSRFIRQQQYAGVDIAEPAVEML